MLGPQEFYLITLNIIDSTDTFSAGPQEITLNVIVCGLHLDFRKNFRSSACMAS